MKKYAGSLITIIGCIIVIAIMFSGVDSMIVMIVLGILNFYLGAYSYIEKKSLFRTDYTKVKNQASYCRKQGKCLMALGAYIIAMGMVYFLNIIPMEIYWDIFLVLLLAIIVVGFIFHKQGQKK